MTEGRPGKETGMFEVISKSGGENSREGKGGNGSEDLIKESEDEAAASAHLFTWMKVHCSPEKVQPK